MTKVEVLRQRLIDGRGFLTGTVSGLDSLIFTVDAEAFAKGVAEGKEREKAKIQKRLEAAWESLYPESGVTIDIHESERAKKRHASILAPKEKP
jgi:hypothetical protein